MIYARQWAHEPPPPILPIASIRGLFRLRGLGDDAISSLPASGAGANELFALQPPLPAPAEGGVISKLPSPQRAAALRSLFSLEPTVPPSSPKPPAATADKVEVAVIAAAAILALVLLVRRRR